MLIKSIKNLISNIYEIYMFKRIKLETVDGDVWTYISITLMRTEIFKVVFEAGEQRVEL